MFDANGNEVPAQIKDGTVKFIATVPAVGFKVYDIRPSDVKSEAKTSLNVTENTLENAKYSLLDEEAYLENEQLLNELCDAEK